METSPDDQVDGSSGLPTSVPSLDEVLRRIQALPPSTWWVIAAIPALLLVVGLVGSLFGRRSPEAEAEVDALDYPDEAMVIPAGSGEESPLEAVSPEPGPELESPPLVPFPGENWASPESALPPEPALESRLTPSPLPAPLPPEAALVPGPVSVPPTSPNKLEQARADLAEGRRQLREGQYEASLLCFNSAIEATEVERLKAEALGTPLGGMNAIATQAQTQRGHALGLLDQTEEAMESYNTALGLDSTAVEAWVGKGRLLIALGRYEEALFCFDSALEVDSSLGAAWAGKAQALLRLGRYAEGHTCHNRAVALGLENRGPFPPYPTLDPGTFTATAPGLPLTWPGGAAITPPSAMDASDLDSDPDVPLDLQRLVMGLPSADTDLAYAFPSDYGVPPELAADVAQLPSQPESNTPEVTWPPTSLETPPIPAPEVGTAPWIRPAPLVVDPAITDVPEGVEADPVEGSAQGDSAMGWPTPKAMALDPSAIVTPIPTPTVPTQPGDFVPPEETTAAGPQAQALPSEVVAAMASIPAGSPDAFGPWPTEANPNADPANVPVAVPSWIRLSLDQSQGPRFYVLWHIDDGDRLQAKQAGGDILAVRLYDVTGHPTQTPLPAPVEEQRCHDDFAQDWYLPIPQWDRIYLAEIGYLSATGQWQIMARSSEVPAIADRHP